MMEAGGRGSGRDDGMQLRRSWDWPAQDVVEQRTSRFQTTPAFGQMKRQAPARAAENGSAGQHLRAERGRFSIGWQASCTLELREQVEDQQHGPECGFGSEELLHAKSVGPESMLQFSNPILHVGSSIVIAPDFLGGLRLASHENAKGVTRNINQFAAYAMARFADAFTQRDEASLCMPAAEL